MTEIQRDEATSCDGWIIGPGVETPRRDFAWNCCGASNLFDMLRIRFVDIKHMKMLDNKESLFGVHVLRQVRQNYFAKMVESGGDSKFRYETSAYTLICRNGTECYLLTGN